MSEDISTREISAEEEQRVSRRRLLQAGALGLLSGFLGPSLKLPKSYAQNIAPTCPPPSSPANLTLTPFVDPLPIPPVLNPVGNVGRVPFYELSADQFDHQFHSQLGPAMVWGFNGMTPGPTIVAYTKKPIAVKFINNFQSYVVCPDPRIHGAVAVPALTVHAHGILDRPEDDGFPEQRYWPGDFFTNNYPNIQEAATYWYHDHSLGTTRINVYSGALGYYLLRDSMDAFLKLPKDGYEIPLAIGDKEFNPDGTLWFPFPWEPEFFGRFNVVNQKVWPYLKVDRSVYRFRILDGSDDRFYRLTMTNSRTGQIVPFYQIGTDGSFLPFPVQVDHLLMAPAERADVLVDFTGMSPGDEIIMTNDAPAPFPTGVVPTGKQKNVMKFVVQSTNGPYKTIPRKLRNLPKIPGSIYTRTVALNEVPWECDPTLMQPRLNNLEWIQPATETPFAGSTEIWQIVNTTGDTHPIHLHQTQFQIIQRQNFDIAAYLAAWNPNQPMAMNMCDPFSWPAEGPFPPPDPGPFLLGKAIPPDPNELGLKDTVRSNPGQVTTIKVPFGPFKGMFVWHCHILSHEDNEMMRPLLLK